MTAAVGIDARVHKVLLQTLGVEDDEITPKATLLGDLGAESIDCLDIAFRLEREFMIKIPRGELFTEALFHNQHEYLQDGRVTEHGLSALRSQLPFADFGELERNGRLNELTDVLTVDLLVRYVKWKFDGNNESALNDDAPALVSRTAVSV
jgi:acyl carrier protein